MAHKIRKDLFFRITMKTVAYLRISTGGQDLATQKLAILDYAGAIASRSLSSSKPGSLRYARQREQVLQTVAALQAGDRLVVSELSRLGRSLGQIIQVVDRLPRRGSA